MTAIRRSQVLCCLGLLGLVVGLVDVARGTLVVDTCGATNLHRPSGGAWVASCSGGCDGNPGNETCNWKNGKVIVGGNTWYFCACAVPGTPTTVTPTCCYLLVGASGSNPDGTKTHGGDCPSCPASGACGVGGHGTEASPFSAACL